MTITQQINLHWWLPTLTERAHGAVTIREGIVHAPQGTVECLTQRYYLAAAIPQTTVTTRLRMVYGGCGWEYAEDGFHDAASLPALALDFARQVADKHLVTVYPNSQNATKTLHFCAAKQATNE